MCIRSCEKDVQIFFSKQKIFRKVILEKVRRYFRRRSRSMIFFIKYIFEIYRKITTSRISRCKNFGQFEQFLKSLFAQFSVKKMRTFFRSKKIFLVIQNILDQDYTKFQVQRIARMLTQGQEKKINLSDFEILEFLI